MTAPEPGRPEPGPDAGVDDIEKDIEATRKELGETVEALSAKLDVKQQAKDKVDETKAQAKAKVDETKAQVAEKAGAARHAVADNPQRSVPVAAIVMVVAVAAGIIIWRRRR